MVKFTFVTSTSLRYKNRAVISVRRSWDELRYFIPKIRCNLVGNGPWRWKIDVSEERSPSPISIFCAFRLGTLPYGLSSKPTSHIVQNANQDLVYDFKNLNSVQNWGCYVKKNMNWFSSVLKNRFKRFYHPSPIVQELYSFVSTNKVVRTTK